MNASKLATVGIVTATPIVLLVELWFEATPEDIEPTLLTVNAETIGEVRSIFDDARFGPRVLAFFPSACETCDRSAAALQALLEDHDDRVTIFAVWEPLGPGDPPPSPAFVAHLRDRRVTQLWDPELRLSDAMRDIDPAVRHDWLRTDGDPDGVLYDALVVFGPGERWDTTLPAPDFVDGGYASVELRFHDQLHAYPP